jgi:hypothetical protein
MLFNSYVSWSLGAITLLGFWVSLIAMFSERLLLHSWQWCHYLECLSTKDGVFINMQGRIHHCFWSRKGTCLAPYTTWWTGVHAAFGYAPALWQHGNLSEDVSYHSKVKHIDIAIHSLWEHVACGQIKLNYVKSLNNTVDIFTKAFPRKDFECLHLCLGLQREIEEEYNLLHWGGVLVQCTPTWQVEFDDWNMRIWTNTYIYRIVIFSLLSLFHHD